MVYSSKHGSTHRTKPTSRIMSARHQNSHRKWKKILTNRARENILEEPSGNQGSDPGHSR